MVGRREKLLKHGGNLRYQILGWGYPLNGSKEKKEMENWQPKCEMVLGRAHKEALRYILDVGNDKLG